VKIAVRYYTKTGNTKKLAEAVAEAAGVPARSVVTPLLEDVDVLFLCCSVYAAGVAEAVKRFMADNKVHIGTIVNISTASLLPSTYGRVVKEAKALGIPVAPEEFHCRGSFGNLHKGHPDEKDLAEAKAFVKNYLR